MYHIPNFLIFTTKTHIFIANLKGNLHTPLIKWYLEQLLHASQEMKQNHGLSNQFQINFSLKTLLASIRYQKLGYIPENILFTFRDFCAVLFYLDLRDKFSLSLRQYSRYFIQNQLVKNEAITSKNVVQMCIKIIDYGNAMLSFSSFLKGQYMEVKDIVLSTIARLTKFNEYAQLRELNLEQRLAICVGKLSFFNSNPDLDVTTEQRNGEFLFSTGSFDSKLSKLLESWKEIKAPCVDENDSFVTMAEIYEHNCHVNEESSMQKLKRLYGHNEGSLNRTYELNEPRVIPCVCGGYDLERTAWCGEFLELFFKLGFEQTEEWEQLVQSVNQTPLLPEFYEVIRSQELSNNDSIDKQYLMAPLNKMQEAINDNEQVNTNRRRRSILSNLNIAEPKSLANTQKSNPTIISHNDEQRQVGLFRSYSIKAGGDGHEKYADKLDLVKKSVSFNKALDADNEGKYSF